MKPRLRTLTLGLLPSLILGVVMISDHIPGTNISLTVPYAAEGKGPTFNTLERIDGKEVVEIHAPVVDHTRGHLNMTTVSVRTDMTFVQALGRWLVFGDTIVPIEQVIPQHKTKDEIHDLNQQAFASSESLATTAALHYLQLPLAVEVVSAVPGSPAENLLREEDRILAVNDQQVTTSTQLREMIVNLAPGTDVHLKITRGGAAQDVVVTLGKHPHDANKGFLGINMATVPAEDIEVNYNLKDIGGPSAGMIFALAVIDKLSPGELNHGKFVAGTGTITDVGEVGGIGGIRHKAAAAAEAGAELFLAPTANCRELAGRSFGEMKIAAVSSLDDAVKAMDEYAAGTQPRSCEDV